MSITSTPFGLWYRLVGLLIASLWICIGSAALAAPRLGISLKNEAMVDDSTIHLGDIADIFGAGPQQTAKLAGVRIKKAPRAGRTTVVRIEQVVSKLRRFGLASTDYRMAHSGQVVVTRRSVAVSPETIAQAVRAHIQTHAPWQKEQIRITGLRVRQGVQIPPGPLQMQVRAPKHTDWLGSIPFTVTLSVNNRPIQKIVVPAALEVWSDVLLAAKPLGRGQPVDADDIKTVRMNLARAPSNAILSMDQALGRRAKRAIAVNAILRSDQIEIPPVVNRGDFVQVVAQSDTLRVSVKGVAKQSGGVGERIRVQNVQSKKMIHAMVVDGHTVRVDF